jgi:NAD(P)-dependent dehydrogenase (short-subunit alcohol dehydrogenase family)
MTDMVSGPGHRNPVTATLAGILDLFGWGGGLPPSPESERLDGRTCLVTGANSGLGKAVAIALARRGGHVLMACRSGIPEAGEDVKREARSPAVAMLPIDLADLDSVHALCDELHRRRVQLDVVVLNAGLMPAHARRTAQGFEVMFGVHFLANRLLLHRLLEDGVIAPAAERPPRIVFVSSETHRSADPIDFEHFGAFVDYGPRTGLKQYASTKLHMCTLATELSRRLNPEGETRVAVHALCPGPINSNIAREAPAIVKPLLGPVMRLFFRAPAAAAEPVVYLACAREIEGRTGLYLHMMRDKAASDQARDAENGRRLWEASAALLRPYLR